MPSLLTSPAVGDSLKRAQAAAYLGLAVSTLASWASLGKGPVFVRLGSAVRYRRTDLDAYLADRTVRPSSETPAAAK